MPHLGHLRDALLYSPTTHCPSVYLIGNLLFLQEFEKLFALEIKKKAARDTVLRKCSFSMQTSHIFYGYQIAIFVD
jgi:hypothetical protein